MNKFLTIICFLLGFAFCSFAEEQGKSMHVMKISKKHGLQLTYPSSWQMNESVGEQGLPMLSFAPKESDTFKFLVSAVEVGKGSEAPLKSAEEIQLFVKLIGMKHLKTSVEKEIKLTEIHGKDGKGYFYKLTDATEPLPPGEFRSAFQGMMAVGKIRLTATLLFASDGDALNSEVINILKNAEDVKLK